MCAAGGRTKRLSMGKRLGRLQLGPIKASWPNPGWASWPSPDFKLGPRRASWPNPGVQPGTVRYAPGGEAPPFFNERRNEVQSSAGVRKHRTARPAGRPEFRKHSAGQQCDVGQPHGGERGRRRVKKVLHTGSTGTASTWPELRADGCRRPLRSRIKHTRSTLENVQPGTVRYAPGVEAPPFFNERRNSGEMRSSRVPGYGSTGQLDRQVGRSSESTQPDNSVMWVSPGISRAA